MSRLAFAAAAALLALAAPAAAQHAGHGARTLSATWIEADVARGDGETVVSWDAEGWVGGDTNKLWWTSEGEIGDGDVERAEVQALYSRAVWDFVDAQAGVRQDVEPAGTTWLAAGVKGLMPYLLETGVHVFVSTRGDVQLRARQSFDILFTNRLIGEPLAEIELDLADSARRGVASGFSRVEAGGHLRYEIRRSFAPYLTAIYERRLGGTARLARAAGEDVGGWRVGAGLRLAF